MKPFKLPALYIPLATATITLGGLLMCLLLTWRMHYTSVVATHCKTPEYWPSISATTGDYMPERGVWRVAVALASGPRVIASFLLYAYFTSQTTTPTPLIRTSLFFDMARICCAFGWAFVTSSEDHLFHIVSFALYIVTGFVYQSTQALLCKRYSSPLSYRIKRTLLAIQIVSAIGVGYFYYDHRMTCLAGRYSRSTLCEWIFSVANIFYDASQYLDIQQMSLSLDSGPPTTTDPSPTHSL